MSYFCHLDSAGNLEHTNLQLYSLQKAADAWNELIDAASYAGIQEVDHLLERFAFIVSCLGLSLSQLMGQNCPSPNKEKMDQPGKLLSSLLNQKSIDRTDKRLLNKTFEDFLKYYGAIRHFEKNIDDLNYKMVQKINICEVDRFRNMTIQIWNLVIGIYRQDKQNDIDEDVSSITDVVPFNQLVK